MTETATLPPLHPPAPAAAPAALGGAHGALSSPPAPPAPADERLALRAMAVTLLGAVALIAASWTIMWRAARWHSPQPPAPLVINVANLTDPEAFSRGRELFLGTCSACHGPDLAGMPNSGKPLRTSEFVRSQSDEQMLAFVKSGRPSWDPANTTGVDMPPRGGNPTLNDDNLKDIIAFLRGVQSAVKN